MGQLVQTIDLAHNSGEAINSFALKSHYLSVRLLRSSPGPFPEVDSYVSNILLNGKCVDPENRKLYLFYIDNYYHAAWIIEVDIDTRAQNVVYYDAANSIGFDEDYKIYNARIINGKIIWTDNLNPIYQIDIERAKTSYYHGIGYGQNTSITEWTDDIYYYENQIISEGKYMYKCVISNIGYNPIAWTAYWTRLCMVEDCYYTMKVENFYFAPMPPKLAPTVEYQTDDTRKINNLRQTLFQFAYNYVYMDWRESTYSPACIVAMPNGEEEIATGLATEVISLNNYLKIRVNTGTEEVRKIKIIGRSSQDPSTWFLVEEIDKFSAEERAYETNTLLQTELTTLVITIPLPIVTGSGISLPAFLGLALGTPTSTPINMFLLATEDEFEWDYDEFDDT